MHHVILGAGPAGVTAAESLRKYNPGAQITLVGGEPEPPYARMAIPYYLEGKIAETGTYLRADPAHYDNLGITYRQGIAGGLDANNKVLQLTTADELSFDKLLIATGASPVKPPIPGIDNPGVHTCWTLEDARNIVRLAEAGSPVVLVGAGFIGSIILEALARKGVKLTVVEMGDRMVPRMLDETAGNMLRNWCIEQGVSVLTGTTVTRISGGGAESTGQSEGKPLGIFAKFFGSSDADASKPAQGEAPSQLSVELSSGETLPAALVVIATGVKSNIAFLSGSGLELGDGIKVNEFLATSAPDIYAAGDIAEGRDLSTGSFDVMAIQPVAVEHGAIAARNMAGLVTPHRGSLNMNVLDTLGLITTSFGAWQGVPGGERATIVDETARRYIRLEFDGDRLVGGQSVGVNDHIGIIRGLIQTGRRLGQWKDRLVKSPERIVEAYVATSHGL
ncbi:MAG TPA: NAD(P)/FAD-dependent oxidoreductase [Rhizobiales bacterium]|nr:NAD(P)/FAD-dependent oxidoreductase [Hyphomicrobiales bacterium]